MERRLAKDVPVPTALAQTNPLLEAQQNFSAEVFRAPPEVFDYAAYFHWLTLIPQLPAPVESPSPPTPPYSPTIHEVDLRITIEETFNRPLRRLQKLYRSLRTNGDEPAEVGAPLPVPPEERYWLPNVMAYLAHLNVTPQLPAPPTFEEAFRRFEPIFHTVFYRRYPRQVLDDMKQVALIGLYKKWRKDMRLLEQTGAYVVTAATFMASNFRQKSVDWAQHEHMMGEDNHGHIIGMPKVAPTGRWTDRIDLQLDIDSAVEATLWAFHEHPEYAILYGLVQDVLDEVPFAQSRKKTGLGYKAFRNYQSMVKAELAKQLDDYRLRLKPDPTAPQT